jgi:hypothetical protein
LKPQPLGWGAVIEQLKFRGINAPFPWAAHITLNRFVEPRQGEGLTALIAFLSSQECFFRGLSRPSGIFICTYKHKKERLQMKVEEEFQF